MTTAIILTSFGTTSRAKESYRLLQKQIQAAFPRHNTYWTIGSRMVKARLENKSSGPEKQPQKKQDLQKVLSGDSLGSFLHPHELFPILASQGVKGAIVQSLHLVSGHEFYRLAKEVDDASQATGIRTALGLPLLDSPDDFQKVAQALVPRSKGQALLFIGHGTDHSIWPAYLALEHFFQVQGGKDCYLGVVEGYPGKDVVLQRLLANQITKICLIPFMLVAGVHFLEDIIGPEGSWKTFLEEAELQVSWQDQGLAHNPAIVQIFIQHIKEALEVSGF